MISTRYFSAPLVASLLRRSVLLFLVTLSPSVWSGNPIPADERSLLNGAELFQEYCTQCHGWDPAEQYSSLYNESSTAALDELYGRELPAPQENTAETFVEEIDDWPDWAGPEPEQPAEQPPSLRSEVLGDLNSAIDEYYGDDSGGMADWESGDDYSEFPALDDDYAGSFNGVSGATDLTNPVVYFYGTSEEDLFTSIAGGTGPTMPGFLRELGGEEGVWNVVNYIRSLWDEEWLD